MTLSHASPFFSSGSFAVSKESQFQESQQQPLASHRYRCANQRTTRTSYNLTMAADEKPLKLDTKSLNSRTMEKAEKVRISKAHVQKMADREVPCFRRTDYNRSKCKCNCLHALFAETPDKEYLSEAIADAVVEFYGSSKKQKQEKVAHWIRFAQNDAREEKSRTIGYLVPLVNKLPSTDADPVPHELPTDYKICQSALMGIMGFGPDVWKTYKDVAQTGAVVDKRKREDNSALGANKTRKVGRSDSLSSGGEGNANSIPWNSQHSVPPNGDHSLCATALNLSTTSWSQLVHEALSFPEDSATAICREAMTSSLVGTWNSGRITEVSNSAIPDIETLVTLAVPTAHLWQTSSLSLGGWSMGRSTTNYESSIDWADKPGE